MEGAVGAALIFAAERLRNSRRIEADPLVEQFYQGLMRCYNRLDRRTEAMSTYPPVAPDLVRHARRSAFRRIGASVRVDAGGLSRAFLFLNSGLCMRFVSASGIRCIHRVRNLCMQWLMDAKEARVLRVQPGSDGTDCIRGRRPLTIFP